MATTRLITKEQEDAITCPIFQEIMNEPYLMPCGEHHVDGDALNRIDACPVCRVPINNNQKPMRNGALKRQIDEIVAKHPALKEQRHVKEPPIVQPNPTTSRPSQPIIDPIDAANPALTQPTEDVITEQRALEAVARIRHLAAATGITIPPDILDIETDTDIETASQEVRATHQRIPPPKEE